ncbi:hypothetical protein [Parahaliea aestuarii]|uniref:Lipoprotein n=1 Tax=Parahaliea aestuarii TaxID=1852021 RepID=A0A5C8ZQ19_9GAMM|nr:hypothetical protein [Parahaliea aestuarii]TXS89740.1 hypothetical protein FVW59_17195 [Parahaliea aestuarii]
MRHLIPGLAACVLLAACSDSGDSRPDTPPEPPAPPPPAVTDLDSTGIYRGQIITDDDNLALVTVSLARDGVTAVAIDSDDDEIADIVLWGDTSESSGELHFSGSDGRDGSSVELTFSVEDEVLSAAISLNGLSGDASAQLAADSVASGAPEGTFAREDGIGGLTELSIAADGSVTLSSPCSGSGELGAADSAVNLYRLSLESDCLNWEALVSVGSVEGGGALLSVSGADNLDTRLYQP